MENSKNLLQQIKKASDRIQELLSAVEQDNIPTQLIKELIEETRLMHESTVVLSYHKFYSIDQLVNLVEEQKSKVKTLEERAQQASKHIESETKEIPPISNEVVEEKIEAPTEDEHTDFASPEEEELKDDLESEINSVISNFTSEKPEKKDNSKSTWYDKFKNPQEEDNSLAGKFRKKPITDITTLIGINEKFLFTNELFKGNTENFMKEINALNSFSNSTEALDHFVKLSKKLEWDSSGKAYQQLKELVERRYLNN